MFKKALTLSAILLTVSGCTSTNVTMDEVMEIEGANICYTSHMYENEVKMYDRRDQVDCLLQFSTTKISQEKGQVLIDGLISKNKPDSENFNLLVMGKTYDFEKNKCFKYDLRNSKITRKEETNC